MDVARYTKMLYQFHGFYVKELGTKLNSLQGGDYTANFSQG